jgi:hypothetical protein
MGNVEISVSHIFLLRAAKRFSPLYGSTNEDKQLCVRMQCNILRTGLKLTIRKQPLNYANILPEHSYNQVTRLVQCGITQVHPFLGW